MDPRSAELDGTTAARVRARGPARVALRAAASHLVAGAPLDLVAAELQAAVTVLGSITGCDVDTQVFVQIFAPFRIGRNPNSPRAYA